MIAGPALAADMLRITSRLIAVLEREIEMLRAMKPSELQNLQQEKIVLTAAYEVHAKALQANPAALDGLDPHLRDELRGAVALFRQTLSDNEAALHAAKEATNRVLQAIAEEIQQKTQGAPSYTARNGTQSTSRVRNEPVSIALNQSV